MRTRNFCCSICCFFLLPLLGGCALPNLKPLADSTAQLHTAFLETDSAVRETLIEAGAQKDDLDNLHKELNSRITAMKAVVNYTDSLANITEAGRTGSESAGNLANAVNGFLDALSAPALPSNYVALAKSLYGIVLEVRAADSFSKAVKKADPAIQAMAEILIADLSTLEDLLAQSTVPVKRTLLNQNHNDDLIDYRNQLEKRRRQLEKALAVDPSDPDRIRQLKDINALIDLTRDRYDPLELRLGYLEQRMNNRVLLIRKSREAVREWAGIHAGLASSLQQGLPPNTRLLAATVTDIRNLINEEKKR